MIFGCSWNRPDDHGLYGPQSTSLKLLGGELATNRVGGAHNPGDLPMGFLWGQVVHEKNWG